MIKAGVAVDNYKTSRFRAELEKEEFKILKEFPFTKDVTILQVELDGTLEHMEKLKKLLKRMDINVKQSN